MRTVPEQVLREWWEPFASHLIGERRCSPYTVRNYRQAFSDLYLWLAADGRWERGLDALGPRDLRDFVIEARRRYDRRTLHNHVSGLRTFYGFWMRRGRLRLNPLAGLPLPKLERRLPKFLTEDQMKLLLDGPRRLGESGAVEPCTAARDRLALELLYGGGLRVSELVALDYGSFDIREGVARVRGKGGKERLCPVGRTALEALLDFRDRFAGRSGNSDPVLTTPAGVRMGVRAVQ